MSLEAELIDALARADWPGNVRQLENTIARLAALSAGGVIGVADYEAATGIAPESSSSATGIAAAASSSGNLPAAHDDHVEPSADGRGGPSLKEQVEAFERGLVARALDGTSGNQSEAARRLGVSRVTLIDKMKKYSLQPKVS